MKFSKIVFVSFIISLAVLIACDRDSATDSMMEPDLNLEEFVTDNFKEEVDEMPEILGGLEALSDKIKYPETAKDDEIEGTVFLFVYVDTDGKVAHTEVIEGVRDDLDFAAVEAVRQIEFIPGMKDDEPVGVRVTIPIQYRLSR